MGYIYDSVTQDMTIDEFSFITNCFKDGLTSCCNVIDNNENVNKVAVPFLKAFSIIAEIALSRRYPTIEKTDNGQKLIIWHQTAYARGRYLQYEGVEHVGGWSKFKEITGNEWRNPMRYSVPDNDAVVEFRF